MFKFLKEYFVVECDNKFSKKKGCNEEKAVEVDSSPLRIPFRSLPISE